MKTISNILQFIIGFLLGIGLLAGGAAAVGYVIFTRMATAPNKPIFAEEIKKNAMPQAHSVNATAKPVKPPSSTSTKEQGKDGKGISPVKSDKSVKTDKKDDKSTPAATQPDAKPSPDAKAEDKTKPANPETEAKKEEKPQNIPAGATKGKVTWSSGLSLRADPSTSSSRVGGVDYNSELIILETSKDGLWQKVRVANGTQEGWVKAGNVKKSSE